MHLSPILETLEAETCRATLLSDSVCILLNDFGNEGKETASECGCPVEVAQPSLEQVFSGSCHPPVQEWDIALSLKNPVWCFPWSIFNPKACPQTHHKSCSLHSFWHGLYIHIPVCQSRWDPPHCICSLKPMSGPTLQPRKKYVFLL